MDVQYLKECLGQCLVEGLAQVAERQPADPINFLACWIYRYKINLNEEEKRKTERVQLEWERKEALAELERIERLKAEELRTAQKYKQQQKAFTEQSPEKKATIDLPEKCGAPNLPTVVEIDESHLNEKREEGKDGNLPGENETTEFKQEALAGVLDPGELNIAKNELQETLQGVSDTVTLQEALTDPILEEDLHQISDDGGDTQSEHPEESENEHDIQTRDDTPHEEYKSSHDLNSE
uniref:DPY30 domain-containing protein 1-like n=1 Tax=Euleptes europaea TaxID=460621 RepID=UPI002540DE17|nr:DPY30 domain-containing protein 1-like [Euleptes europaea]